MSKSRLKHRRIEAKNDSIGVKKIVGLSLKNGLIKVEICLNWKWKMSELKVNKIVWSMF